MRRELAGGGVIAATAVHLLDVTLWMLGNPPIASVSAATYAKARRLRRPPPPFDLLPNGAQLLPGVDVEDFAVALIRFGDGSTLSLESSWLQHATSRPNGAQFLAELGVAEYSPLAVRWDGDGQVVDRTPTDLPAGEQSHYFLAVAREFLRSVSRSQPTVIRPGEMLQVQAVMDAMYASARERREIGLPEISLS
jgi:predicted dehydrogenase